MIRSMTGYGEAESMDDLARVKVEVRAVNNKFLKLNPRVPDGFASLEMPVEKRVRERIGRGTVNLNVIIEPQGAAARAPINAAVLKAYAADLEAVERDRHGDAAAPVRAEALLALPGVVGEEPGLVGEAGLQDRVLAVLDEALGRLDAMRDAEGRATADDMAGTLEGIERHVASVEERGPQVVEAYRDRLRERMEQLLEGTSVAPDEQTLVREVAVFAERSDVNEEIARLRSHIAQFRELLDAPGPAGRKFEFITQEMYREVNTLGSKANDAEVSREVVEIKIGVDRLREQSQNVE